MCDLISEYLDGYRYLCYWSSKYQHANQFRVYSKDDAEKLILKYIGEYNLGISMTTYIDNMPKLLWLPFDFDSDDLMQSYSDAKKLFDYIVKLDYYTFMTFSLTGDTKILCKIDDLVRHITLKDAISEFKDGKYVEVLSMKNGKVCYSPVYDWLEHRDIIYKIYYELSSIPLKLTKHHSIYKWDMGNIREVKYNNIQENDYLITFNNVEDINKLNNIEIEHEYLGYGKKCIEKIKVTDNLIKLIGYYISEGHVRNSGQVGFTFNKKEKIYHNEVKELIESLEPEKYLKNKNKFNVCMHLCNKNKSVMQILFNSQKYRTFFEKYCGKGSENKKIPDFMFNVDKNTFLKFLFAYLNGDGSYKPKYQITAKTISKDLAEQLVWLCKMHGIQCRLQKEEPRSRMRHTSYILYISKSDFFNKRNNKFSPIVHNKTLPIDGLKYVYIQCKPTKFNKHRNEQMTLSKNKANYDRINKVIKWFNEYKSNEFDAKSKNIIKQYKKYIKNNIGTVKIKKIQETNDIEDVYDISVLGAENFFAGSYPVLAHNSGAMGFHVFIKTHPDVYTESQMKYIQYHFKDLLDLKTQDPKIIGQHRRIMRIPDTVNMKTGLYDQIMYIYEGKLLDLNKIINFKYRFNPIDFKSKNDTIQNLNHSYPCVQRLVRDKEYWLKKHPRKLFEPAHIIRFAYIIEEVAKGKSDEEILKEIESFEWDDYIEDYTRYQISQIKGTKYIHPSCLTLKQLGYCTRNCKAFDRLLRKYVKEKVK